MVLAVAIEAVASCAVAGGLPFPWQSTALSPVVMEGDSARLVFPVLKQGQAVCEIVVAPSGSESAYYRSLASLLQSFLQQACGVPIPLVPAPTGAAAICLGPVCEQVPEEADKGNLRQRVLALPPEGFVVRITDRSVLLWGRDGPSPLKDSGPLRWESLTHSKGTFYAMADLLERFFGFRFYFPGKLGTGIPDLSGKDVRLPAVSYQDAPRFPLRKSSYPSYETADALLLKADAPARLLWDRLLRSADVNYENFGHTDVHWHELLGDSHPEIFALREDGTRCLGGKGPFSSQRCYTSEAGLAEHLRYIERALAGDSNPLPFHSAASVPNGKYIYWWPNDGFKGCACPRCKSLTDSQAPPNAVHSRLIWDYVLRLSAAVAQRWPDQILKVPLYSSYGTIPPGVTVPENVALNVVNCGTGRFSAAYFKEPAYFRDALSDVDALNRCSSQKIWIWMHYPHSPRILDGIQIPYPVPHRMQEYMAKNLGKITGLYLNGHSTANFAYDGLMVYLWQKLLWNPEIDVDAAVTEFADLWGPAAPEALAFHRRIIERWERTPWPSMPPPERSLDRFPAAKFEIWGRTYPKSVRAELKALLHAAVEKTEPGSLAGERARYLRNAYAPFFDQGEREEMKGRVTMDAARLLLAADGTPGPSARPITLQPMDGAKPGEDQAGTETRLAAWVDDESITLAGRMVQAAPFRFETPTSQRDGPLWRNDCLEFFLCTGREGLREAGLPQNGQYHHLILDARGGLFDAYKECGDRPEDKAVQFATNLKTQAAANRLDFELRLPFASLGCVKPSPGSWWDVNFYRTVHGQTPAATRVYAWAPIVGNAFNQPEYFGRLYFGRRVLWQKTFDSESDRLNIETSPPGLEVSSGCTAHGMQIHLRAEPAFDSKEAKLTIAGIPSHRAAGHAVAEWMFRVQGRGLRRLRAYGAEATSRLALDAFLRPFEPRDIVDISAPVSLELTPDRGTVKSIDYLAVGIWVDPGADVTVRIEDLRVMDLPDQSPN